MNRILNAGFYRTISACLVAFFALTSLSQSEAAETTVAIVAGSVITEADLMEAIEQYKPSGIYHSSMDRSSIREYRLSALNDLIEIELLSREARKRGIEVSETDLDQIVKRNIERFGSEEKFQKALETRGLTPDALKERVRKNQLSAMVIKGLATESRSSDEEVKKYYDDNRNKYRKPDAIFLNHILIKVDPAAPEDLWLERKSYAEQLLEKIKGGADFGSIAYQFSDDSYKFKSGELGFIHRGRLSPPELEDAAFRLAKDELSGVIRTIYGFHILRAGDRIEGEVKEFDQVKDRIRKELDSRRYDAAKKSLIQRLRKEYPVEIKDELLKEASGN